MTQSPGSASLEDVMGAACATIDGYRDRIIGLAEAVWAHPESGFKEHQTARRMADAFRGLGLSCREGLALTGVRAELTGAQPGPTLALLAEMDGILLPEHPAADPVTGAVHACGHHAQLAGLYGAAAALSRPEVLSRLAGRVVLMAVPAEEYLELEFRRQLVREGKIRFLGGKQELIRIGAFRDVHLAMMIHTAAGRIARVRSSMNGFTAHHVRFVGRASHAGVTPHKGINALNAAMLALQAVNAQRETLPEHARVHSIITKGGNSVNTVPAEALVETMARAATLPAMDEAAALVKRCYRAGAMALGAGVEIDSVPGYLPLNDCRAMADVFRRHAGRLVGEEHVQDAGHMASSTDMGDVTQIMPASHPSLGGAAGGAHAADFRIEDPELAYVGAAKVLALCAIDLLGRDAALARDIIRDHPPALTPDAYIALLERQAGTERCDYSRGAGGAPPAKP